MLRFLVRAAASAAAISGAMLYQYVQLSARAGEHRRILEARIADAESAMLTSIEQQGEATQRQIAGIESQLSDLDSRHSLSLERLEQASRYLVAATERNSQRLRRIVTALALEESEHQAQAMAAGMMRESRDVPTSGDARFPDFPALKLAP